MNPNSHPSRDAALVAALDPDAMTAGTVATPWVPAADFYKFMAIVMAGTLGANATLDAKIEQATDAAGAGAKDIADKAIVQLTQAGTDASDTQAIIELVQDDLDIENEFTHIRLSLTVGTATSDAAAVLIGMAPRHGPASENDASSVGEIAA